MVYLRCCGADEDLFIILDAEGTIARHLIEVNDRMNFCLREGGMSQPIAEWTIRTISSVRTDLEKYCGQLQGNEKSNICTIGGDKQFGFSVENKTAQLQFKVCEELRD